MKAILISRVSTEEQKEMGLSLQGQIVRLEKYCQNKGFEIIKSFSFDESAYKSQRDEFDQIMNFVLEQKDKIAICCDKVDRLSRNMFDKRVSALYERALTDQIELHFVSDGQIINSKISAAEKFQFGISLGLAKYYSDAISDNVKRAIEQKLRNGEWLGRAPWGYKNVTRDDGKKDVVVDEYLSHIIIKAFELYATGAFSLNLVCEKLKQDYGVDWSVGYLDKVFNNHFFYGVMLVKGKMYSHRYPTLITKELFDRVQKVKNSFNKKNRYKYAGKPYMYRGLIRCGDCGLAITPEKHKGFVYYHCTQYYGKHNAKWFREEFLTEQLSNIFKKLEFPKDILKQITETLSEVHKNKVEFYNTQFDKFTKEQKNVAKMLDNLYMDKLRGRITESAYDRYFIDLQQQMDEINMQLGQLQEADTNYYITTKHLLNLANKANELFLRSEVEEKRQLIKLVLSNLRISDEKLLWEPNEPFDLILKCSDDIGWRPQGESNSYSRRERAVS